jgi:hypothetical protein
MELKVKDTDNESGDIIYEPAEVPVQKKYVSENGNVSFIFDEIPPPPDGPSNNGFCGMSKTMATKLQTTLAVIDKGSMVKVWLVQKMNNGAHGYRNIARIEPLDISGEPVVTPQAVQAKPVVQNTRTMGRVPPAWEMGVEYNDRKDNKICLNVACKEAVTMFGHITELVAKVQPKDDSDLSKQYDDSYRLAVELIGRLANLPIEQPDEEMADEEQPA